LIVNQGGISEMRNLSIAIAASMFVAATPAFAQSGGATHGFPWGVLGLIGLIGLIPRFRRGS
jgi:hypothetical protein